MWRCLRVKTSKLASGTVDSSEATALSSMTNRRTTAPGAPWDMPPEMQPGEKVALYNRKKNAAGHLKIISVSFLYVCPEIDVTGGI